MMITKHAQSGFTIVELIVTIILIGILAAYAIPKFTGSAGDYDSYAARSEAIVKLRAIQLRAMQDTSQPQRCVLVTSNRLGMVDDCSDTAFSSNFNVGSTRMELNGTARFQVPANPGYIQLQFNRLGQPQGCSNPCRVNISGTPNLVIDINVEGNISAS